MQQTGQEEDQEVEAGHGQRRSSQGVHGAQEEEGVDVLHVVTMSSIGKKKVVINHTHLFSVACNVVTQLSKIH